MERKTRRRKLMYFRKNRKGAKWHIKHIGSEVSLCGRAHESTFDESATSRPAKGICARCKKQAKGRSLSVDRRRYDIRAR